MDTYPPRVSSEARATREETPTGSNERRAQIKALVVLAFAAGAGFGLYKFAQWLPAQPKTLERDSVVIGLVGAILVVQEFVRETLEDVAALAYVAPPLIGLVTAVSTLSRLKVAGPFLVGVLGAAITAAGFAIYDVLPTPKPNRNNPFIKYGPLVLGFIALTLAMFLQLRAINLRG